MLFTFLQVTDNISQNVMMEYLMVNSLFESLMSVSLHMHTVCTVQYISYSGKLW